MLLSVRLLLLVVTYYTLLVNGQQQVGVSLQLLGQTIPNNSLVNLDDLLYQSPEHPGFAEAPTNANGRLTLMCVTDLVACCETQALGDWYYPDGTRVTGLNGRIFRTNRGQNEVRSGLQFYGSVRLWRRYTPPERGIFRCEIPDANGVNQALYVSILFFTRIAFGSPLRSVAISSSGSTTAGETVSLTCSATLHSLNPTLPDPNIPPPTFEWFFGPNGNGPLPSGSTPTATVLSSSTYTSTLQFSPLSQSLHTGNYTCQLGAGSLMNNAVLTVNAPAISVQVTISGAPMLGQNGYSLTCGAVGVGNLNPSITYQWTKSNGTQTQLQAGAILSFSPLRLSDAGQYTCQATVSSPYLNNNITRMDSQNVTLQIPSPTSVMLSSNIPNPIPPFGSDVTLICTVVLTSGPEIDIPLNVNFELLRTGPVGSPLTTTTPSVTGSTYITTAMISSFGRSDSGNYTCRATVNSASTNTYISVSNTVSDSLRVTTSLYLTLTGVFVANNSNIYIRSIGQSSDNPNGALQCITDRIPCCFSQSPRHGEWYLPNGELVQGATSTTAFYRNRRDNGEVSLNRPSNVMSPSGRFCCEVADATDTNQTLCVNIGGLSIMTSGSLAAGESYILECSAGDSMANFQWLKGPADGRTQVISSDSITISSTSTTSQLQFRPLQQSDNGSYTCNATVGGLSLLSEPVVISVNAPSVSVQISNGRAAPTAGEDYQLTCSVSGVENLNPTIAYQWMKNSGSSQTLLGTNSNTLSFTPLRLSDAASYGCEVTISSSYLSGDIIAMSANVQDVRIQTPTPSTLTLTGSDGNPVANVVVVGSDTTLTCTLVLNSAILGSEKALLMVDAQLSKDGTPLALSGLTVNGTTFTYTTQLNSFRRTDSGNYTCTTTVRPQPSSVYLTGNEMLSSNINIKAASAPPLNVQAIQSNPSSLVEVSWSPPSDRDNIITGYRIFYDNGQSVLVPSVIVINSIGLKVDGSYVGQNVSIRSEADQLYSELVNISVIENNSEQCAAAVGTTIRSCSCASEVGIAVGAVIVVVCLIVIVAIVIVVLCLWRKKSSSKSNFTVSANMAYGEVTLKPMAGEVDGGEYENPDKILKPGQWTGASTYEPIHSSHPEAPEYASTEETVCTTN